MSLFELPQISCQCVVLVPSRSGSRVFPVHPMASHRPLRQVHGSLFPRQRLCVLVGHGSKTCLKIEIVFVGCEVNNGLMIVHINEAGGDYDDDDDDDNKSFMY